MSPFKLDEETIFDFACKISSREMRAEYLAQACGADKDLRDRLAEMLDSFDKEQSYLEEPALGLPATVDSSHISERPGDVIGPYKLLQTIGEGGFGVVYMAEQSQPVRRKVALKVIKPGMDTKEVVARFEAERQALAMMNHPNIAKVYDGGETESGRPYFVMELVRGVSITEYADAETLPTAERLKLFTTVCKAIQHAHQKGIIHRDIKPSNVLITEHDGKPVPKVIDFGVAKAINQQLTDRTIFTQYEQIIGTPIYMSPEQASLSGLDIDTRSDIYSLGVLLYELLTGTTPFDSSRFKKAAYDEIRRIIREEEPPKPSTKISLLGERSKRISGKRKSDPKKLQRLMRGELDWIIMKALDKERGRRYETAQGFAIDVQRFLDSETVLACPPSTAYRMQKFVRRNRTSVTVACLLFLALSLGALGMAIGWREAVSAKTEALREKENSQLLNETLADILELTQPTVELGGDFPVSGLLDLAYTYVHSKLAEEPMLRSDVLFSLGNAFGYVGDETMQEKCLNESLELRKERADGPSTRVAKSLLQLADLRKDETLAEEALAISAQLKDEYELRARILFYLAETRGVDRHRSRELREKALETIRQYPEHGETQIYAAICARMSRYHNNQEEYSDAVEYAREAIRVFEATGRTSWNYGWVHRNISIAYFGLGEFDLAVQNARRSIEIADALPARTKGHEDSAEYSRKDLLGYLASRGKYAEAREVALELIGNGTPEYGLRQGLYYAAGLELSQGNFEGALAYYEQILQVPKSTNAWLDQTRVRIQQLSPQSTSVAVRSWDDLMASEENVLGKTGGVLAHAQSVLNDESASPEALDKTFELLLRLNTEFRDRFWVQGDVVCNALLCWCQARIGNTEEAISRLESLSCTSHEVWAQGKVNLAYKDAESAVVRLLQSQGKLSETERVLKAGLAKRIAALPPNHAHIAFNKLELANILMKRAKQEGPKEQRFQEAVALSEESFDLLANHEIAPPERAREAAETLVEIYAAWGKDQDAKNWRHKAAELKDATTTSNTLESN